MKIVKITIFAFIMTFAVGARAETLAEKAALLNEMPIEEKINAQKDIKRNNEFQAYRYDQKQLKDHIANEYQIRKHMAERVGKTPPKAPKVDVKSRAAVKKYLDSQSKIETK